MAPDHTPSPFGVLVAELQGDTPGTEFAAKLGVSASTIRNVRSGGRQRSEALRAGLVRLFRIDEQRINRAYDASPEPKTPHSPQPTKRSLVQKKLAAQQRYGRREEAVRAIELQVAHETDDAELYWLYDELAKVLFAMRDDDAGLRALARSVAAGNVAAPDDPRLAVLRNRLASRYQRQDDFSAAHDVVDDGLHHNPTTWLLWRRKGIVHWYEHAYSDAIACLEAALHHKAPLRRIIHSRGCVLAEWGNYHDALRDLNIILDTDRYVFTPVSLAYARTARAHINARLGHAQQALDEFAQVEQIVPGSSWLYYFRGLCYLESGHPKLAIKQLTNSLSDSGIRLNLPKRIRAEELLRELRKPNPS